MKKNFKSLSLSLSQLFLSQIPLSLSKIWTKIFYKTKKRVQSWNLHFVGNWLEWAMRGGAVEWGQDLVREYLLNLVWEFEREKIFQFWGVLTTLGFWSFYLTIWAKIEVLRKFKFAAAIHDLGIFIFRNP